MRLKSQRTSVRAPEDADNRDILEKDEVEWELMMMSHRIGDDAPYQQESARTCSIAPPAKPTTSARPPHATHLSASIERINTPVLAHFPPPSSWGAQTFDFSNRVIDYVDAASTGDVHDVLLPTVSCVVDYNVRTALHARDLKLVWRRRGDNMGTERFIGFNHDKLVGEE